MWTRQNLERSAVLMQSRKRLAILSFAAGAVFGSLLILFEPSALRYEGGSVFSSPRIAVDYLRLSAGVLGLPMYLWLLGSFEGPTNRREENAAVLVFSGFGGIVLATFLGTGFQVLKTALF